MLLPLQKNILIAVGIIGIIGVTWWAMTRPVPPATDQPSEPAVLEPVATTTASTRTVIGTSVQGREIVAHTFGTGDTTLMYVGGMHGGYEWNSVVLAEELMWYLEQNTTAVPADMKIIIIPNLNPDGVYATLGMTGGFTSAEALAIAPDAVATGRFNANGVDLNRNFDCKWAPESTWRGAVVSAGSEPFSEPEARALRDIVLATTPDAVIFWHSQANTVYASECLEGVLPETKRLMTTYATAAQYGAVETFDAYPITGDAEGWLASIGIPAVTVELESRTNSEWPRNLAGIEATVNLYETQLAR